MSTQCVVCKQKLDENVTRFQTESGEVCSAICAEYLIEQKQRGNLDESESLNEVQLML